MSRMQQGRGLGSQSLLFSARSASTLALTSLIDKHDQSILWMNELGCAILWCEWNNKTTWWYAVA